MLLMNSIKCLLESRRKISLLLLSLGVIFLRANCDISAFEMVKSINALGKPRMLVHFINIPSGEAVYIEFPDAGEILIYGGNKDGAKAVMEYLYDLFQEKEGYVVATFRDMLGWHQKVNTIVIRYPGEDALGGVIDILDRMEAENLYGPLEEKGTTSPPYLGVPEYLLAFHLYFNPPTGTDWMKSAHVETKKKQIITKYRNVVSRGRIKTPEQIESDVSVEVVSPPSPVTYSSYIRSRDDQEWVEKNAFVMKVKFNEVSFLFIGNMENTKGTRLTALSNYLIESDIVEISSQGSEYPEVFNKIKPKAIVFSRGEKKVKDIYSDKLGYKPQLCSFYDRTKLIFVTDGKKVYVK